MSYSLRGTGDELIYVYTCAEENTDVAVLVTGGEGFIGSAVIKKLVAEGERVVCMEPKTTGGRLASGYCQKFYEK